MTWTTDACARVRTIDGVVEAAFVEASDGLPFSKVFRGEVQIEPCDDQRARELIEQTLAEVYEAGGNTLPKGSLSLYSVRDGVRKNLRVTKLELPDGLRGWGSSITIPEGWLSERFGPR